MRHRLRPPAAFLLALSLFIQLLPPAAGAGGEYLVAVNEEVLEMTQETMPFWSGGHLYVSNVIFSGSYRSLLGVAYSRPPNKPVVLYSLHSVGAALFFDLETGQAYDGQNNTYNLPAIQRGSYVFFPVDLVAHLQLHPRQSGAADPDQERHGEAGGRRGVFGCRRQPDVGPI